MAADRYANEVEVPIQLGWVGSEWISNRWVNQRGSVFIPGRSLAARVRSLGKVELWAVRHRRCL